MYQLPSQYVNYYKDYIDRDVREFKLECNIASETDISSINIEYDLLSGSEEYCIGNLAAAKLTMVVSSNVSVYETNEIDLTVKVKIVDGYGNTVWVPVPMGRFYVFNVSSTKLTKTIIAYDDLYKTTLERTYNSSLEYPTTVHNILDEICPLLNISYYDDIEDQEIVRPEIVTESVLNSEGKYEVVISDSNQVCLGMKVGETLSCIASYLNGNFIVDGDRKLKLIKYPTKITKSYPPNKYAMPTVGVACYNMNKINCTTYAGNVINVGFDENSTSMELTNPFMSRTRLLTILEDLNDIRYYQSRVRVKGDPTLQLGDLVEIYEINSVGNIVNRQNIPILRMTFSYTGGCTNEIESPCKAEAEKTINYKGTISSRIDSLESSMSSTKTEVEELNQSVTALKNVKANIDDMNRLVDSLSDSVNASDINKYNSLLALINESDEVFEDEYNEIYNNRYL